MTNRYTSVAISLHWLIAFFIIGLLAVGKYMTHLEESDPLRYTLTQLHKSAGITVLLLAVFRIFWRLTHKPPALPQTATVFERVASTLTHVVLYLLMVAIPVSGWVLVSASLLNIDTILYGIIPWPHISFINDLPDRGLVEDQSALVHLWLGNTALALVILHTAAAFYHQWVRRDNLISRMVVSDAHRKASDLSHGLVAGVLLAAAGSLFLFNSYSKTGGSGGTASVSTELAGEATVASDTNVEAGVSGAVGFTAFQGGDPIVGTFDDVEVALSIDKQTPESSSLMATVMTGSVATSDAQMQSTMVTSAWFASKEFPQATFESSAFSKLDDTTYAVTGDLSIKGTTQTIEFELSLEDSVGRGEFTINRSDYDIGDSGQDEFAEPEVVIRFEVQDGA